MDVLMGSAFPATAADPRFLQPRTFRPIKVSVQPPPPGFDFRESVLPGSREAIARTHPHLLDLAEDGTLLLVEKRQFGPVPAWRTEFVEPQEIWLVGTSHISQDSAGNVERVVRALSPDNVVVELCRSRQVAIFSSPFSFLRLSVGVME
ncbi:hypothetical protein MLD38_015655 [Melastoma candidum]|uniref:Uncharacterized protein n=1 Tax=Melastoma candidum TaxID=119954 RepID=A0ACB9RGZ4_9MYRT|nr:hypothetical protein MLD38_015655 [Melastoma candidum]